MNLIQEISEEEMNSLTQSILTRYGIDFTCYEPKSLRRRIIRVMNLYELPFVHELWVKFLRDPKFITIFMNEVSVGMTSMFRDPVLWKNLKTRMYNQFQTEKSISVWHAGCSTGEEVYSFGILLKELNMQERTKALATDFNVNAIDEAQKGIYHKIKMIENETNYRQYNPLRDFNSYYTTDGTLATMNPELIAHATFHYQNLITDPYSTGFDVIFCRNVMIYFDTAAKNKLLDKFYNSLKPGGYFILGFFDTMTHLIDNDRFSLIDDKAKIFRKV